ncbi:hypothetical protein NXS19_000538 [Fusarium pseudograminearum]|nr:hypothetical protein NXS19_000538 [Fusarium pseudograminearum]
MTNQDSSEPSEFWLYGYGSLIWKPPPHFDQRIPGWVDGYVRRFWQVSSLCIEVKYPQLTYYRPVKITEAPQKLQSEYGALLTASSPEKVAEVKEYLDIREINGYTIHYAPFQPADGSPPIRTLVYIGTPDNEQFVGPQDPQKLAEHIFRSQGPSGLNKDYLLSLDTALSELAHDSGDVHIHDLARRVRELERSCADENKVTSSTPSAHRQKHSTEEAEEIEEPHH